MLDKQHVRRTSFPTEPSVSIMQMPAGKARSDMMEGADHVTEEDGDERKDKISKPFRGTGRR